MSESISLKIGRPGSLAVWHSMNTSSIVSCSRSAYSLSSVICASILNICLSGSSVDLQKSGETTIHYDDGSARQNPYDPLFLTEADLSFLQTVLSWQLPRIIQFEDEIRKQSWIPQGYSNTHQFVVFPPEQLRGQEINTQYFDFRPYASRSELMRALETTDLNAVPTEQKIMTLF